MGNTRFAPKPFHRLRIGLELVRILWDSKGIRVLFRVPGFNV